MLASFFHLWSFSYTSRAGLIFIWGVSLKHPVLASFLCGEILLHISCWLWFHVGKFLLHIPCCLHFFLYAGRFSYTSSPVPFINFYRGCFCYTSRVGFIFIWEVAITHPMFFFCFFFFWGVSLTHPVLTLFLCRLFLLQIQYCLHFYAGSFLQFPCCLFMQGISLTHPIFFFSFFFFSLLFSGEFLLHIPCWIHFYLGSFSYTSRAGFICIWGVSLTHPVLVLILSRDLLLHIPCWLHFYQGSFSYTSRAGFICMQGISLTHPTQPPFFCREFVWHIPCCLHFYAGSFSYT